jgi:hypothetical protein
MTARYAVCPLCWRIEEHKSLPQEPNYRMTYCEECLHSPITKIQAEARKRARLQPTKEATEPR